MSGEKNWNDLTYSWNANAALNASFSQLLFLGEQISIRWITWSSCDCVSSWCQQEEQKTPRMTWLHQRGAEPVMPSGCNGPLVLKHHPLLMAISLYLLISAHTVSCWLLLLDLVRYVRRARKRSSEEHSKWVNKTVCKYYCSFLL